MAQTPPAIIRRLQAVYQNQRNNNSTGNDSFNASAIKTFMSFQTASNRIFYLRSEIEKLQELELNGIRSSTAAAILDVNISCVNKLTLAGELTPISGPSVEGFQYNVYIKSEVEELKKKRHAFKAEQVNSGKSSRFGRISGNRYSKIQKAKLLENKQ